MNGAHCFAGKLSDKLSAVRREMTSSGLERLALEQLEEAKERGEITPVDRSLVESALTWHEDLDVLDSLNLVLRDDGEGFFTIGYPAATKHLERQGAIK